MPVSHTEAIERIARVLAGQRLSVNAKGAAAAAARAVNSSWRDYRDDAIAVLKTLREPDAAWEAMIRAALAR
jgi:hypothetical protein